MDGYKVFHVEVNMNAFKTWDNDKQDDVDYAFSDITPIKAVIPCLAGKSSKIKITTSHTAVISQMQVRCL